MNAILFLTSILLAFGLAYTLKIAESALVLGRQLSGEFTGTGYQDAISPPWATKLAMCVYAGMPLLFIFAVATQGWGSAAVTLAIIFLGGWVAGRVLPQASSPHFLGLIHRSMISRYADYVRDGDALRADAMKDLLITAGLLPAEARVEERRQSRTDIEIINDYGEVLELSAPPLGYVSDVERLPHPKDRIKEAIVAVLRRTDDPKFREQLKTGYLYLSSWQVGVGLETLGFDLAAFHMELLAVPENEFDAASKVAVDRMRKMEKWTRLIEAERISLPEELRKLGLW